MTTQIGIGTRVAVRRENVRRHVRTPDYVRGRVGTVVDMVGSYRNPERLAYGFDGLPKLKLFRVCFRQCDLWPDYAGAPQDTAVVEIYESWIEPVQD